MLKQLIAIVEDATRNPSVLVKTRYLKKCTPSEHVQTGRELMSTSAQ